MDVCHARAVADLWSESVDWRGLQIYGSAHLSRVKDKALLQSQAWLRCCCCWLRHTGQTACPAARTRQPASGDWNVGCVLHSLLDPADADDIRLLVSLLSCRLLCPRVLSSCTVSLTDELVQRGFTLTVWLFTAAACNTASCRLR